MLFLWYNQEKEKVAKWQGGKRKFYLTFFFPFVIIIVVKLLFQPSLGQVMLFLRFAQESALS
jgi:hypothetical protein